MQVPWSWYKRFWNNLISLEKSNINTSICQICIYLFITSGELVRSFELISFKPGLFSNFMTRLLEIKMLDFFQFCMIWLNKTVHVPNDSYEIVQVVDVYRHWVHNSTDSESCFEMFTVCSESITSNIWFAWLMIRACKYLKLDNFRIRSANALI